MEEFLIFHCCYSCSDHGFSRLFIECLLTKAGGAFGHMVNAPLMREGRGLNVPGVLNV